LSSFEHFFVIDIKTEFQSLYYFINSFNSNLIIKHLITLIFIYTLIFFLIFCSFIFIFILSNKIFFIIKNRENIFIELLSFFLPLCLVILLNFILVERCISEILLSLRNRPIIIKVLGNQ
jgi:hypothetical protein